LTSIGRQTAQRFKAVSNNDIILYPPIVGNYAVKNICGFALYFMLHVIIFFSNTSAVRYCPILHRTCALIGAESKQAAMLHHLDMVAVYLKPSEHKPDNSEKGISRNGENRTCYV